MCLCEIDWSAVATAATGFAALLIFVFQRLHTRSDIKEQRTRNQNVAAALLLGDIVTLKGRYDLFTSKLRDDGVEDRLHKLLPAIDPTSNVLAFETHYDVCCQLEPSAAYALGSLLSHMKTLIRALDFIKAYELVGDAAKQTLRIPREMEATIYADFSEVAKHFGAALHASETAELRTELTGLADNGQGTRDAIERRRTGT